MSISRVATTAFRLVAQCCDQLAVPVPPKLSKQIDVATKFYDSSTATLGAPTNVAELAMAALIRREDPSRNPQVINAVTTKALVASGVRELLENKKEHDIGDALREHADLLLSAWSTALEPACTAIMDAVEQGIQSLNDPVSARGPELIVWAEARNALQHIAVGIHGIKQLRMALSLGHVDDIYIYAAVPPSMTGTIRNEANQYQHSLPWMITKHDVPLSFPASMQELEERAVSDGEVQALDDDTELANA